MNSNITIGMDLGDKFHIAVVFDRDGNELEIAKVKNTKAGIQRSFKSYKGAKIAIEAGTHSPWISRLLNEMGLTVFVGNPRKLRFIWDSDDKSDERDARMLGMVCRIEPRLLHPLRHRGSQAQADMAAIKSRDILVQSRTKLINHARGIVKANGERLPKCSTESFVKRCKDFVPSELCPALKFVFETIQHLTEQIKKNDRQIEQLSIERYPETKYLRQVSGIGPVTALAFVLTIEDPVRFSKSRQIGPFLGLTPRRDQSGDTDKQLAITKAGNMYLRQLLVGSAHYIMGPFGPESNLRLYGITIGARGGKNAKKRAAVAVARKLAVLLHRLWVTKEEYQPFYGANKKAA
ncbi:MAG: IS110 family transposase [Pseudomonadota bacterium]